jgi:hypothetical protein
MRPPGIAGVSYRKAIAGSGAVTQVARLPRVAVFGRRAMRRDLFRFSATPVLLLNSRTVQYEDCSGQ